MKTIYKYPLSIQDEQTILLPEGALILSVQMQDNQLCLWACIDTEEKTYSDIVISIHGTGRELRESPGALQFIATVQDDVFVWHIFERISIGF